MPFILMVFIYHQSPQIIIAFSDWWSIVPVIICIKTDHQKAYRCIVLIYSERKGISISRYGSIGFDNANIIACYKAILIFRHTQLQNIPYIFSGYLFQFKHTFVLTNSTLFQLKHITNMYDSQYKL